MEELLFEMTDLSPQVLQAVEDMNFKEMTNIQSGAIPIIMQGKDLIGRSSTGTGKTAAFGLPAVESIKERKDAPQVLILCPTRELATQIAGELNKFAKYKKQVNVVAVYGGAPVPFQVKQLRSADIVVGTPGRVMDHMRRNALKLHALSMVVLDEADEMLNMGFYDDIDTIMQKVPEERQTLLFSATMPPAIMKITRQFLNNPVLIAVDKGKRTLDSIEQRAYYVPQVKKMDALNLLLQAKNPKRCVVFCNTKHMVDELSRYLVAHSFQAAGLHGDMRQPARDKIMNDFKSNRLRILVATDVAARGIDVDDVGAVINYDIPQDNEYYIHRIGRTGRAGKEGVAYSFASNPAQIKQVQNIARYIGAPIVFEELPSIEELQSQQDEALKQRLLKALDTPPEERYASIVAYCAEQGYGAMDISLTLLSMLNQQNKRKIPNVRCMPMPEKNVGKKQQQQQRPRWNSKEKNVRISVSIGRQDRVTPNVIVSALAGGAGIPARAIGKIEIRNNHCEVELPDVHAQKILKKMQNTNIKNKKVTFRMVTP
ncbi:DEAD/DEAH box helicase [Clostridia bacterium OttesenSCG-928-F22]|nr:DEAD/DEAH box helicase [Clostridia bacterium OttesenSCG-928-F22]